jgi:predicted DNA-binding transcriptional regulator AlpA
MNVTEQASEVFLTASQVRARYNVSDMALWRWSHRAGMNFPRPYYFARYRRWKLAELEAWEATRISETSPEAA